LIIDISKYPGTAMAGNPLIGGCAKLLVHTTEIHQGSRASLEFKAALEMVLNLKILRMSSNCF